MGFIVKVVIALIVIAGGAWAYLTFSAPAPAPVVENTQPVELPPPVPDKPAIDDGGISTSGSSDTAIASDLATLDTQAQAAQGLSADMDSSFTDKPIEQTE